jgi:hypothetical protein
MGTARIHSNAVPIFYNISAKADKSQSGEALLLVQIIGFADYYNLSAKADKSQSGEAHIWFK